MDLNKKNKLSEFNSKKALLFRKNLIHCGRKWKSINVLSNLNFLFEISFYCNPVENNTKHNLILVLIYELPEF